MKPNQNIFGDLPKDFAQESVNILLQAKNVRVERIVSHGQHSPKDFWYDQDQHEWVIVLSGHARLQFADRTIDLHPGDFLNIPSHEKHRVDWTATDQPTIWLAIFYD